MKILAENGLNNIFSATYFLNILYLNFKHKVIIIVLEGTDNAALKYNYIVLFFF